MKSRPRGGTLAKIRDGGEVGKVWVSLKFSHNFAATDAVSSTQLFNATDAILEEKDYFKVVSMAVTGDTF